MLGTRRSFLKDFAEVSGVLLFCQSCPPIPEPRRRTPVDPPAPAEPQSPDNAANPNTITIQRRTQEKEFRQTMDELFTRVRDLKAELATIAGSRRMPELVGMPPMFRPPFQELGILFRGHTGAWDAIERRVWVRFVASSTDRVPICLD